MHDLGVRDAANDKVDAQQVVAKNELPISKEISVSPPSPEELDDILDDDRKVIADSGNSLQIMNSQDNIMISKQVSSVNK